MSFSQLLDSFKGMPALVIGDLMLDEYHFGHATRISPEAPVMVIRHEKSSFLPGGAANVALNLKALGATVSLVGVAGIDTAGNELETCLKDSGLSDFKLFRDPNRPTTKKTRIVADHSHQVLRLDFETEDAIDPEIEDQLLSEIQDRVAQSKVVVISDYRKGVCTAKLVDWTLRAAKKAGIPVVANPKPQSLDFYKDSDLVSLNRSEAAQSIGPIPSRSPEVVLDLLRKQRGLKAVLVTLGEGGMTASGAENFAVPAPKVEVYDTAGAGDTVIATVALGMASVGFKREVFELAAQTAACVVRHVGVATPSQEDLAAIRAMN